MRRPLHKPIVIDEVQKVPSLLDEIHWLIENKNLSFLLCGSSARKLKRGHANLLGGRAWRYELFPLVSAEIGSLDLLRALNQGLIPLHYLQDGPDSERSLKAYVQDYLKEEVFAEGLARNIPAFSRFLDAAAYSQGELVNYSNIARDCGVDSKTVREYYQIISDTLLGALVEPYKKRQERQVIGRAPKSYFFDVGVAGVLTRRRILEERGEAFGRAFEHLVFMELNAYRSYSGKDFPIHFWRTKSGQEGRFYYRRGGSCR
jgi:predicted AAA+ superfamily ATPase